MKLAIMQPYLFPYIGYFQLMNAVDKFIILDDVNFIKKGWINRNKILLNGRDYIFTIPLKKASQNKLIKDMELAVTERWMSKFLKTLELAYNKAPYFDVTLGLIRYVMDGSNGNLKDWYMKSFRFIMEYLDIDTILSTSNLYNNRSLKGSHRILDLCIRDKADQYINAIGGRQLYEQQIFEEKQIKLKFLEPRNINYTQYNGEFVPFLSIIDVMMFNSQPAIKRMLNQYHLVN